MSVTTPVVLTEAIAALLLAHVPPVVALLNVVDVPKHRPVAPVIAATVGLAFTVTDADVLTAPQLLVTV
jgi:hypothetical protein